MINDERKWTGDSITEAENATQFVRMKTGYDVIKQ